MARYRNPCVDGRQAPISKLSAAEVPTIWVAQDGGRFSCTAAPWFSGAMGSAIYFDEDHGGGSSSAMYAKLAIHSISSQVRMGGVSPYP
jgi:hypothetical protein